eukprot:PhF_6_TR21725/c0_g1_i1/m.31045
MQANPKKRDREGCCAHSSEPHTHDHDDEDSDEDLDEVAARDAFHRVSPVIEEALQSLKPRQRKSFLRLCNSLFPSLIPVDPKVSFIDNLRHHVRSTFPSPSDIPPETLHFPSPKSAIFSDCTNDTDTVVVDAFLYDDDDVDGLCEDGTLHRSYCGSCGSTDVRDANFVSHSFSTQQLGFLFDSVLKEEMKRPNGVLVDVGSRLGIVVAAAAHYAQSTVGFTSIGIEMNSFYVQYSRSVLQYYKFDETKRATIEEGDVFAPTKLQILQNADVVVLNNVFEWFQPNDQGRQKCWKTMQKTLRKKGQVLICVPSLKESFEGCGLALDSLKSWVQEVDLAQTLDDAVQDDTSSVQS